MVRNVVDDDGFEGDFYEDDEPLDKIQADFAAGQHVITGPPNVRAVRAANLPHLVTQGYNSGIGHAVKLRPRTPALQPTREPVNHGS